MSCQETTRTEWPPAGMWRLWGERSRSFPLISVTVPAVTCHVSLPREELVVSRACGSTLSHYQEGLSDPAVTGGD